MKSCPLGGGGLWGLFGPPWANLWDLSGHQGAGGGAGIHERCGSPHRARPHRSVPFWEGAFFVVFARNLGWGWAIFRGHWAIWGGCLHGFSGAGLRCGSVDTAYSVLKQRDSKLRLSGQIKIFVRWEVFRVTIACKHFLSQSATIW